MKFRKPWLALGWPFMAFYWTQRISWGAAIVLGASLISHAAKGQEQWEKEGEGEIKDVEIEIVKDRKITLPRAVRNFGKIPPRPYEPIQPVITYELKNFRFATPDYKPIVRPLKLKQEDLSKIYGNYLSGGVGNYTSLYAEGSFTTKRDKNKFFGAHVYTRSFGTGPVDGKNSAGSTTQLQVFGKGMGKVLTWSGDANADNRATYFYGYDPALDVDRNKIRQTYSVYSVNTGIENTKPGDFNYSLRAGYSYLQDHYLATESEASFIFSSDYRLNEKTKILLNADYFVINRNDSMKSVGQRQLLRIKGAYQFTPLENLLLTTGANIAVQNDQYAGSKNFHAYPHLKAQYKIAPAMELYGLVTGDIDKVDLHSLSGENMWITSNIPIYHTNRALEFRGGITGKIGRKFSVGAGLSAASLKNYYYYLTVRNNLNSAGVVLDKFTVVYDGNTKRLNPFAEIAFAQAEVFSLSIRGDYFNYSTDIQPAAFHRPTYRFSAMSRYNFYEKISLEAGFIAQGGMKSLDPTSNLIISLDPAFDLNLKVRYFLSKQFSAFVQLNNMLSNKYPMFQSYPVRGFQALGGVSWSF